MGNLLAKEQVQPITKLGAAERQLNEAIKLFFEERDPIVIHTLLGAVLGILDPYAAYKKIAVPLGKDCPYIKEEYRGVWIKEKNKAYNFFKHADRDPDAALDFDVELNVYDMFEAILFFNLILKKQTPETLVFLAWLINNYPELVVPNEKTKELFELGESLKLDFHDKAFMRKSIDYYRRRYGSYTGASEEGKTT